MSSLQQRYNNDNDDNDDQHVLQPLTQNGSSYNHNGHTILQQHKNHQHHHYHYQSPRDYSSQENDTQFQPNETGTLHSIFTIDPKQCVALDCEMVGVGPYKTSVLARVSLTDYWGKPILDTIIKIHEKVTDYRTASSGIRPQDLESSSAMEYGACRRLVLKLCYGKILIGHALENDLKVLGLYHPAHMIRDTSMYPVFMKTNHLGFFQPRRLKDLVRYYFGITIQQGTHCSLEDAQAAMQLYKLVKDNWDRSVGLTMLHEQQQQVSYSAISPHHGQVDYAAAV
jgi:RNA exonuclease 4